MRRRSKKTGRRRRRRRRLGWQRRLGWRRRGGRPGGGMMGAPGLLSWKVMPEPPFVKAKDTPKAVVVNPAIEPCDRPPKKRTSSWGVTNHGGASQSARPSAASRRTLRTCDGIHHLLHELLPRGRCALVALLGSKLEQLGRSLTVLGDTDALGEADAEVVLRVDLALVRGEGEPARRLGLVLLHPLTKIEPADGLRGILLYALAPPIAHGEVELRGTLPLLCRHAVARECLLLLLRVVERIERHVVVAERRELRPQLPQRDRLDGRVDRADVPNGHVCTRVTERAVEESACAASLQLVGAPAVQRA
eukprot:scaffold18308_cov63-Phaeocystis_antarctica.AAC.2